MNDRAIVRAAMAQLPWILTLLALTGHASGGVLTPRSAAVKPAHADVQPWHDQARIAVKFKDGLSIRLRDGELKSSQPGELDEAATALNAVKAGQWRRSHDVPETRLDQWRQTAQNNLGREVADLNLQYDLLLPPGMDAAAAIDLFNALNIVEIALPVPVPVALPVPNDYQSAQGYLKTAPGGVDALGTWQTYTTTGAGVKVADIEYSWNLNHQDLPAVTMVGPAAVDPFNDKNHGTAVLGEMASIANAWGTTGIAYSSQYVVAAANTAGGYNVASAITNALTVLGAGDVILIEQQIVGPNGGSNYVPVEWYAPYYNAIVTAVGNGVTVVEAAGNGNQNLDSAAFSTGNGGHWPFLPQNDSGAIIVGAGAAFQIGSDVDRSRLGFSTYGSTVDLQGWGEQVLTTGYGNFYAAEGVNLYYTANFSGTSSASPIVAGAVALVQSRKKTFTGSPYTPAQVRNLLVQTGSPQQAGTYPVNQNIGPRPNVVAALTTAGLFITNDDCTSAQLKGRGTHSFSNAGATTDGPDEPGSCVTGGYTQIGNDVWFKFVAQCTGTATVSLCGASFNTKLAIYQGCPTMSGQLIACNDDYCGTGSQVTFPVTVTSLYHIRIGGFNGATGGGMMTISCAPAPTCAADVSGDGQVNVTDLLAVINAWGTCAGCPADTNNDGLVNVTDLLTVINGWGPCP